jgi:hypothetical protein
MTIALRASTTALAERPGRDDQPGAAVEIDQQTKLARQQFDQTLHAPAKRAEPSAPAIRWDACATRLAHHRSAS